MVPKQDAALNHDTSSEDTKIMEIMETQQYVFGSQLVDENSTTPYTDATQVRVL